MLSAPRFCQFGIEIRTKLVEIDKSQSWLIKQVAEKTGLYFDYGYLYRIMAGRNKNPKIIAAIREILELPNEDG